MRSTMKRSLLPTLLAIAFFFPGGAEARRGLVVIDHGENILEIGEGIATEETRINLRMMLDAIVAHQQQSA